MTRLGVGAARLLGAAGVILAALIVPSGGPAQALPAATPSVRFRRAVGGRRTAGYAVCGRSQNRGYVQRLAVHPDFQRTGTGRRLLLDGLHWMRRRGATTAVVNTQTGNEAAFTLYCSVGFREDPIGLSVLSAGLW